MTIEAKIICDSVGPNGVRITTYILKYPRFIHSELMTHRAFSRNASSSRAIPFEKQMKMIEEDMAKPLEFRANQKGMQAGAPISDQELALFQWEEAGRLAIDKAKKLAELGVHKQYVNRLVEPFAHISVVLTATEYSNFFALRHHSMAQPEIAELAKQMWDQYSTNKPKELGAGGWHLPFVSDEEITEHVNYETETIDYKPLIIKSVARCARVSYLNHDNTKPTYEQDEALYDRLLGEQPIHASPAEHQAQALPEFTEYEGSHICDFSGHVWSGNFRGWTQFRKTLEGENITSFEGPLG